jgi:hypothetical protein
MKYMLKILNNYFVFFVLITSSAFLYGGTTGRNKEILISEKVYLHIDRRVYVAGENLLYSFYLIDTKADKLASYSSIGYVSFRNQTGEVLGKSQVRVENGIASGAIYLPDTLKTGYYQVVAYTNFMRNGSEDIFYKSQVLVANRFDKDFFDLIIPNQEGRDSVEKTETALNNPFQLNIIPTKSSFGKREKAGFKINIKDQACNFADLTISVVENNTIERLKAKNIKSANNARAAILDLQNVDKKLYLCEDKYAELQGVLTEAGNGNAIANKPLYLSTPDSVTNFKYAVTDAKGVFRFALPDYYSGKELFIKVKEGEALPTQIIVDSKFQKGESFRPETWQIDSSLIRYLRNSQDIVRIQKTFSQIQTQYTGMSYVFRNSLLYKRPDFKVFPAEYVDLKDFTEISREIIPPLKIRKRDNVYTSEILDISRRNYLPSRPLIFLDGVILDDISQIIPYGTKDIKRVEVISSSLFVDNQEFNGVLSVFSNNNLWKTVTLNSRSLKIKAETFYEFPKLTMPDYSLTDVQSREPDFRQLLYWNPHFHVNADKSQAIEFYTSDNATSYLIKVSGVTDKGEKIEAYSEFEVVE